MERTVAPLPRGEFHKRRRLTRFLFILAPSLYPINMHHFLRKKDNEEEIICGLLGVD